MIGVADYIIGVIVLLVPVFIGFYYAYRDANKASREEYLLGGRSMSLLPVTLSLFITFQSALSLIGIPNEAITFGAMLLIFHVGQGLSFVVGAVVMVPLMYPLRITSIFEYIELRYKSRMVRLTCTLMGMLHTLMYMAFALLAPALALEATVGLHIWLSVVIFGAIGTLYTALGGIKSVIWTDTFQTVFVLVGVVAMIIAGTIEVGGVSEVWRLASDGGRLNLKVTTVDPRARDTYLGAIFGVAITLLVAPFSQSTMQRMSSLGTLRLAKLTYLINFPLIMCYGVVLFTLGSVVYAYFAHKQCDPIAAGFIADGNQLCPYFVMETLGHLPGFVGLYVSTLCCGSLSTLSSGINSLAANMVEDFLAKPLASYKESTITLITKIISVAFGAIIICLAYATKHLEGPVSQIALMITGALGTPVVAVFMMSGMIPWANKYGAMAGAVASLACTLWINVGRRLYGRPFDTLDPFPSGQCAARSSSMILNQTELLQDSDTSTDSQDYGFFLYDISFQWDGVIGVAVAFAVGLSVSFITRSCSNTGATTDRRLIAPIFRRFWNLSPSAAEINTDKKMETDLMLTDLEREV